MGFQKPLQAFGHPFIPFFTHRWGLVEKHEGSPRYKEESILELADAVFQQHIVWFGGLSMGTQPGRPREQQPGSCRVHWPSWWASCLILSLQTTGLSSRWPLHPLLPWSTPAFPPGASPPCVFTGLFLVLFPFLSANSNSFLTLVPPSASRLLKTQSLVDVRSLVTVMNRSPRRACRAFF